MVTGYDAGPGLRRRMTQFAAAILPLAGCASQPPGAFTSSWAPDATIEPHDGIRSVRIGHGPPLVLLHTIRTQADYYHRLAPLLTARYEVTALDLPGHGLSELGPGPYDEPRFRAAVVDYIVTHDLRDVTLVGESIGGVLALTVAAEIPSRITAVVSANPYDYGDRFGGGIRRSPKGSTVGLFETFKGATPETKSILRGVMRGGFAEPEAFPEPFLDELHRAGRRRGFRKVEYATFAGWKSWIAARERYKTVQAAVTLVYGRHDWSLPADRQANRELLKPEHFVVVGDAGHFASLERPGAIAAAILQSERARVDAGGSERER